MASIPGIFGVALNGLLDEVGTRASDNVRSADMVVPFTVGSGPDLRDKIDEYERQLSRQIEALNRMTANEVRENWDTVEREGKAQSEAREKYEELKRKEYLTEALGLEDDDPDALDGLTAEEWADKRTEEEMDRVAALHEPDLVAGGRDEIPDDNGMPSMGDRNVNSSIGSQWQGRRDEFEEYIDRLIAEGRGDDKLDLGWILEGPKK
ncbi:polymorphic toxin type 15 domain-containing protein [Enemella sp. A6]|uniref:polymorphic toxin type 15 domain-containing protein n=1 Tax=Enemella sp. A6 TaxID=3440152 RepID=UPI003EC144D9